MSKSSSVLAGIIVASAAVATSSAQAATISIDANASGWYNQGGKGVSDNISARTGAINNWMSFDLSGYTGTVDAVTLVIHEGSGRALGDRSNPTTSTYTVYDVSTDLVVLDRGFKSVEAYTDLGSGAVYGDVTASFDWWDEMTALSVSFFDAGVTDVEGALGGMFALGGALTATDAGYAMWWSGSAADTVATLQITGDLSPVPLPASVGFLLAGVAGLGWFGRRKAAAA